jgi:hypothetical protein
MNRLLSALSELFGLRPDSGCRRLFPRFPAVVLFVSVFTAFASSACVPDFDDETSRITGTRVLAIRAFPAEAAKNQKVELTALIAAPDGSESEMPAWSLCVDRKPLSELGPVSPRCLASPASEPEVVEGLGEGPEVTATLPAKVCQLFGPERPDPKAGEPSGRPVDPDSTGGFYQPVLSWLDSTAVLGAIRLDCPLSGATREATVAYNERHRANQNPELEAFELVRSDGNSAELGAEEVPVLAPGEQVRLRARFGDCVDAETCRGAEDYVLYDREAERLEERRETLVVSWFSSSGELDEERSDRDPAEELPAATNTFTAPSESGELRLWAVVRDDRGGVSWRAGRLRVD